MEGTIVSLLPPLAAIVLCIYLREAVLSLFAGVYIGALLLYQFNPLTALFRTGDEIMLGAVGDPDHIINLMFTIAIGGLVEIFNRSPASAQIFSVVVAKLKNRLGAGLAVWLAGLVYFIDDYANALIVGNAFRKVMDLFCISRAKLAFLVDTTSAPITSLALVSTWIGFEVSLLSDALQAENIQSHTGLGLFVLSIPYRFYPLLALGFSLIVVLMQRDFGPMLHAEKASLRQSFNDTQESEGPLERGRPARVDAGEPSAADEDFTSENVSSWQHEGTQEAAKRKEVQMGASRQGNAHFKIYAALIPILTLIGGTLVFLAWDGSSKLTAQNTDFAGLSLWQWLFNILSQADPFRSLLWSTMTALIAALAVHSLVLGEKILEVFNNWLEGCRNMFTIVLILILAWSIGDICGELKTGAYVASLFDAGFDPKILPLLTFLFAAGISFATGTSFATMSILVPIVTPLVTPFIGEQPDILFASIGSVLGGAIFGDHCSPISDTTILSAGASGCSVVEHVRTQLPYALLTGALTCLCLLLIVWLPLSPLILTAVMIVVSAGILRVLGKQTVRESPGALHGGGDADDA